MEVTHLHHASAALTPLKNRGRPQRLSADLGEKFFVPDLKDCSVGLVMPKTLYVGCVFVQVSLHLFNDASSAASVGQYRMAEQS
jgi:hypothetical protein